MTAGEDAVSPVYEQTVRRAAGRHSYWRVGSDPGGNEMRLVLVVRLHPIVEHEDRFDERDDEGDERPEEHEIDNAPQVIEVEAVHPDPAKEERQEDRGLRAFLGTGEFRIEELSLRIRGEALTPAGGIGCKALRCSHDSGSVCAGGGVVPTHVLFRRSKPERLSRTDRRRSQF